MINGKQFKNMIISAANNLENSKDAVNNLNIFPVPDGDTGTNMSMTICSARRELERLSDNSTVSVVADTAAMSMLKGARGNSGVILSLLFRGFSKQFKGETEVSSFEFAKALETGVKNAYGAVRKPTEGTILTVARVSSEKGLRKARQSDSEKDVLDEILTAAKSTLDDTPNMLPVLKQANVVDAGGKGLVLILEGMVYFLENGTVIEPNEDVASELSSVADFSSFSNEDIKFSYCTELVIEKTVKKDIAVFKSLLERIGDSIVCVEDDSIIKLHVHTNNPGKVIEEGLLYGSLINIKVENMKLQHTEKTINESNSSSESNYTFAEPVNDYGFVAVCAGDGLSSLFKELSADTVVEGGQTMNPSTDDILAAVKATPAKTVFILPNNKNIIMAAEQVIPMADRKVIVLPTKNIPQGITAMLSFDSTATPEENTDNMTKATLNVKTANITFAARDSVFDGHTIKQGEYLGLVEGKVNTVSKSMIDCFKDTVNSIVDSSTSVLTVYIGDGVSQEDTSDIIKKCDIKGIELNVVYGGQPVYYYIFSAE